MDANADYYAVLGLLPNAEDIIVRAAYKALAQRYHPDRHSGPTQEATERMAEINEAYAILSDPALRAQYDALRGTGARSGESYFGSKSDDAAPASDPLAEDWQVALTYFPDLKDLDVRLSKISWRLAYAFRAVLLEQKSFPRCGELAVELENGFLREYFGPNPEILAFARHLILQGRKPAAKALNDAVRVLGKSVPAHRVNAQIVERFQITGWDPVLSKAAER